VTRTPRRLAVALATAAALALPANVVPAGAAACKGVHRNGEVSVVDLPVGTEYEGATVAGGAGVRHADVLFAATARTLWRSPDAGCTWTAALSLDADSPPPWRATPNYTLWSVSAAPAGPDGHHAVYAVAGDGLLSIGAALPVVTYVSRDDGLHWTVHEPTPADVTGGVRRCTQTGTRIAGAPEPGTAYLTCTDHALGELPVTLFGPACQVAAYVTHDYAATWQTVAGPVADPALVSTSNPSGCHELNRNGGSFVVDRRAPKTLWELDGCSPRVRRSVDGGRTFAAYADLPRVAYWCPLDARAVPGLGTVLLACDPAGLLLVEGKATDAPKLRIKVTETGQFTGCALDPVSPRAIGFYYDARKRCVAYAYDLARKTFRVVGYALPDKAGCAWRNGPLASVTAAGSRAAYAFTYWASSQLLRVGPP
jgi:hypothetical protein